MKILQKVLTLPKKEYLKQHLNILNALLDVKLTTKEIDILIFFMCVDLEANEGDRFNTFQRKKCQQEFKIAAGGLANYFKTLTDKGFLQRSAITNKLTIKESVIPEPNAQGYQFKIKLKKEESGKE